MSDSMKRINVRIDGEVAARAKAAYSIESGYNGTPESFGKWVELALLAAVERIESTYNDGQPFHIHHTPTRHTLVQEGRN